MASYHLSVKTIQRSAGRSATATIRGVLTREQVAPTVEREDPLAHVVERLREAEADAPSFRTDAEARAFRGKMERRFDRDMLARIGRGEEATLAQITDYRLDRLCLARAWLDSQGEPERLAARMSLVYRISDAQIDRRREREAHQEKGHSWGL